MKGRVLDLKYVTKLFVCVVVDRPEGEGMRPQYATLKYVSIQKTAFFQQYELMYLLNQ